MLTALRSSAGSWVAKIFIAVLALSFAVWGIADVFRGSRTDVLATVGDHEITAAQFDDAFKRQIRAYSQRLGQPLTPDQARQFGLDRQVLNDLLGAGALEDQASRLKISISDKSVAQDVADNPTFQNSKGEFDPSTFRRLLQANGLSEGEFLAAERRQMIRNTVVSLITEDVPVPNTLAEMVWRQRNEARDVAYFSVSGDGIEVPDPTDQEVKAYYDSHQAEFAVPERRSLDLIPVQPSTVANLVEVSDDDIKKIYDERKDLFESPEKRVIEQIAFQSEQDARTAYDAIKAGTRTFDEEATARGLTASELKLGEFTETQYPDQTIAKQIFALPEGEVSPPLKGRLSTVLARVTSIVPAEQKTLTEARDEIANLIRADKSRDKVLDVYGQIEDARASGSTLEEIAANLKLPLVKIAKVDREGMLPDGKEADIPDRGDVLAVAFDSDVGVENDPVQTKEDGYVWVDVREVIPATIKPLDDVRDKAVESWKASKRREAILAKAEEYAKEARGGASFDQLAQKAGSTVQKLQEIKRNKATVEFDAAAVQALFDAPPDGYAVAADNDGKHAKVIKSTPVLGPGFDSRSEEADAIRKVLSQGIGSDLFGEYVADLEAIYGVKINEGLWQQLAGGSS